MPRPLVQTLVKQLAQRVDPYTKQGGNLDVVVITGATNASPIVITATNHGFQTGDTVLVAGVLGNTAANGTFTITRVTVNTFSLDGSTGSGAYTSGGSATTIGVSDGDRFTKQRLLDIYNLARMTLFNAMKNVMTKDQMVEAISGAMTDVVFTFTATYGNRYTYGLPSGYLRFVGLNGYAYGNSDMLTPIILLPANMIDVVKGSDPAYQQSNTNRFVFEIGTSLIHFGNYVDLQQITGTVAIAGDTTLTGTSTKFLNELMVGGAVRVSGMDRTIATIVSNTSATVTLAFVGTSSGLTAQASTYHLKYIGISDFALSDVTGASTTETLNTDYHYAILEIATAIANEQGNAEVLQLANQLLNKK
jgi:hypothetical protein